MKHNILQLIILIALCLHINSCAQNEGRVEIDLNNCMINSLSPEERSTLTVIVKDYEKHLINKGILKSTKPLGYFRVYRDIAKKNSFDFSNDFGFSGKIDFLSGKKNEQLVQCHKEIFETERFKSSKPHTLKEGLARLKASGKVISPDIVAQNMVAVLDVDDFELEYYRLNTLLFIESLKDLKSGE